MVVMAPMAVASMDASPNAYRGNMRAGPDTMVADTAACADRTDMGSGIGSVTADPRTHTDNRAGMAAGIHTVIANPGARADRTDMGPGADTMAADMRPDANTQHIHMCAHVRQGGGWGEQSQRKQASRHGFHGEFFRRVSS